MLSALAMVAVHHGAVLVLLMAAALAVVAGMAAVETTGVITEGQSKRTYLATDVGQARGIAVIQGATDPYCAPAAAANALCLGIQEEDTINAGDPVSVICQGEAVCVIGAAVASGAYCKVDADGRLVPSTATGDNVIAMAVSTGANVGDYIVARIMHFIHP